MNYAYSWGAAVVILGTLFKLTHLPGANVMLFIGMGTEVFVFFIAAFDRPFDKTAEGRNLATDSELAAQLAAMDGNVENGSQPAVVIGGGNVENGAQPIVGGGSPIIVGGGSGVPADATIVGGGAEVAADGEGITGGANGTIVIGGGGVAGVPPTPAPAVSAETAEEMEDVTKTYIERLNELNDVLVKVSELSQKISIDSEEMANLNRSLTGIARVYEMQLKAASQQITTQEDINVQLRNMTERITELNAMYARMIEAMSVNVK